MAWEESQEQQHTPSWKASQSLYAEKSGEPQEVYLLSCKQLCFVLFQRIHVAADDFKFLCLFIGEDVVNSFLNLEDRRFAAAMHEGSHIKRLSRMLQQLRCDGGCTFAEHITEHVIKLEVGNIEAILGAVFLSRHEGREFDPVAAEVSKLPQTRSCLNRPAIHCASFLSVFFPLMALTNFGWLTTT